MVNWGLNVLELTLHSNLKHVLAEKWFSISQLKWDTENFEQSILCILRIANYGTGWRVCYPALAGEQLKLLWDVLQNMPFSNILATPDHTEHAEKRVRE